MSQTSHERAPLTSRTLLAATLALLVPGICLAADEPPALPGFELTDHMGDTLGREQLAGHVWVANFVATRSPEATVLTRRLRDLQAELFNHQKWNDVRLISITVDPAADTEEALYTYAHEQAYTYDRHWRFVTGPREQIAQLLRDGFGLAAGEAEGDPGKPILRSRAFVLVDRDGRLRGSYEALTPDGWQSLLRDLEAVLAEPSSQRAAGPGLPRVAWPEQGPDRPPWHDASDPDWMAPRRQEQLATAGDIGVFHDFRFTDRITESGILFTNRVVDDAGKSYKGVHYDHGNGVAVADVDGDGLHDLYFTTQLGRNQLWRNLGGGKFEDITAQAGVAAGDRISVTASFADTDNDGDPDLLVTVVKDGNLFFENDGRGHFKNVTGPSGLGHGGHSSSGIFFDYDRDGLLDLFLTNVGQYTGDERGRGGYYIGFTDAFSGHLFPERTEHSILYRNTGGNRFVDVTEEARLADDSWTGDASPIDLNEDGYIDLYVLDMQGNDEYFENVGGKHFVRKSREVFPLTPWGSMAIKVFDFDNDGDMDIYITDMHSDMSEMIGPEREKLKSRMQWTQEALGEDSKPIFGNALFRNDGEGRFEEISDAVGAENYWPWGFSVGDLNADGYDDAFLTSSMNFPWRYGVNSLLLNDRGESFRDSEFILGVEPRKDGRTVTRWFEVSCSDRLSGHPLYGPICKGRSGPVEVQGALGSRASVLFDLDRDGDLDIVTNEFNSEPMVLVSNLAQKTAVRYLEVRLVGSESNRDGLGARVTLRAGGRSYVKVHDGKSGYLSQSSYPLYFGLGNATEVEEIEVLWPSGRRQSVPGPIATNTVREITEK